MNEGPAKWFRFGLRTTFVVMAVVAVTAGWLTYHINWIIQRRAVLAGDHLSFSIVDSLVPQPWDRPPFPLDWLGAEAAGSPFWLPANTSNEELARIQRLFPETIVRRDEPELNPYP